MFRNYFLISYRCHRFFSHFCFFLTKQQCESFFEETISVYFLNHLCRGSNGANSIFFRNWNRSSDEHQASKQINLYFSRERRTGRRSNRGMSHFGLCKTEPNNASMLCMNFFLFCVLQFFYVVYDIFWLIFLYILCMTLSLT